MRGRPVILVLITPVTLAGWAGCQRPKPPATQPAAAANTGATTNTGTTPSTTGVLEDSPMPDTTRPGAASTAPIGERFTGILRGGILAVGAETTGWQLERPDGTRVDVSVSNAVDAAATANEGKPVVITGTLAKVQWVERGEKPLLIADRIESAQPDP